MPLIGLLLGGVNFADLKWVIKEAVMDNGIEKVAAATLNYGNFIQVTIDFLIIALAIFMAIKAMNSMKKKEEPAPEAPAAPSAEETLLGEIRDLLKTKK